MFVIKKDNMNVPLKIFSKEWMIEPQCLEQMETIWSLPFLYKHMALMPDWHLWIGASIGSVVATKWVIIPSLVGVDIGCWMSAVKTSITNIDKDSLKKIMWMIRKSIPVWFNKHKEKQDAGLTPAIIDCCDYKTPIVDREFEKSLYSLWTLWGWNHFIEIQKWSDGYIWIMIHSGSRNLGKQVADHYNKIAIEQNEKWHCLFNKDLAFLPVETEEGQNYIREMQYCVDFAFANRRLMMERVLLCFLEGLTKDWMVTELWCIPDDIINIAHNYARLENHWGKNVRVHRKGATSAKDGEIGIIPWSQWTKSYIVRGIWNRDSFMSCSHWAGRKMWRKDAQRSLDLEAEKKILDDLWVIHGIRHTSDLDEAPSAYKDIDIVMEEQKDLVDIVVELTPLAVVKG